MGIEEGGVQLEYLWGGGTEVWVPVLRGCHAVRRGRFWVGEAVKFKRVWCRVGSALGEESPHHVRKSSPDSQRVQHKRGAALARV